MASNLNFTVLSKINLKTKLIVFGYIRQRIQSENCPKEICVVCLLFYAYGSDEWDTDLVPDTMQFQENAVKNITTETSNAYFKRIMINGYYEWSFKIPTHTIIVFRIRGYTKR